MTKRNQSGKRTPLQPGRKSGLGNATGGGRSHRERVNLAERREKVAQLYLAGHTQAEIAGIVHCSRPTVTIDLQLIRRDWRQSSIANFNERVEKELEAIDRVELEAWAAWERSQHPEEQVTETTVPGGKGKRKPQKTKVTRGQCGDPRYLAQIADCIAQRRKLLGLDAPVKSEQTITADVNLTSRFLGRAAMRREVELGLEKLRSAVHEAVTAPNPN